MSITRLQQARQMYAMGQRVGGIMGSNAGSMLVTPTRDGSRPGYYGPDAGHENDPGHGSNAPGGGDGGDRPETTRPNPHTDSGYSKTSTVTGDEMKSAARDFVQTLNHNNAIRANQTGTKFEAFDNFVPNFAPTRKGPSLLDIALFAAGPLGLFGKTGKTMATAVNLGKRAKKGLETVTSIADQFGFENPMANMFSGNKTSKTKSTTKNNTTNNGGDGEGLASLDNQASGYDEYILLLQKLQSGNISDAERNRFNVLKNMLGI